MVCAMSFLNLTAPIIGHELTKADTKRFFVAGLAEPSTRPWRLDQIHMRYCGPQYQCIITGKYGADLHHVKSRGSGGPDAEWNLMPLSHRLHVECEQIGLNSFCEKYQKAKEWLLAREWYFDLGKWRHRP